MTPRFLLLEGSITETVLENCSAAYTRSRAPTAKSGAFAAKGTWPAPPGVAARRRTKGARRPPFILASLRRGRPVQERPHVGDLFPLLDDDRLRQPLDPLVAAVLEHRQCHVDRTLMMRDHHAQEVAVDVTTRSDRHVAMHGRVGRRHLGVEGRL